MPKIIKPAGNSIDFSTPIVMGILNLTTDSFYDGGKYDSDKKILKQIEKMINDGAFFIDIGAYSSRPNGKNIDEDQELKRIIPALELVHKTFPEIIISIDTFRSKIAEVCLNSGASIINDISAGELDKKMMSIIGKYKVPYIMMHMRGNPQNMMNKISHRGPDDEGFWIDEKSRIALGHRRLSILDLTKAGQSTRLEVKRSK